ncbi:DUF1385 domain-containing protein [Paenibacillus turpanensis]|uniref:DUF1385 domain-containing protein n=1 Tax=Paenibacillus turpanensis TaxID=2689078 RepID=UPI00140CBEC7|nr:DUF1385 domain-containing protein [Paenibacillus turpanensis]
MSQEACPVPVYGGQAVIEGVMFAGQHVHVTAVRRKNKQIDFFEVPKKPAKRLTALKKIPFIRGLVALVESSAKGSQHLNFSAEAYAEDSDEPAEQKKETMDSKLTMILGVAVVGVLSFIFGKFIFTLVPVFIEDLLFGRFFVNQDVIHNLIEGFIKIILLVVYIQLIAQTPLIKRLFQYHGAEHKVITAYEAGDPLTVANVQKYNTLHYRCGSSFMVFTVLIGVIIYSLFSYDDIWERVLQRIALLPVVVGVSYEVLRFTNSVKDNAVLRWLGYPGLMLQKLTTKEPTDDQVEVAIASFQRMLEADRRYNSSNANN